MVIFISSFISTLVLVRGEYSVFARQDELDSAVVKNLEKDVVYIFTAPNDGDFYIGVYVNNDEFGIVYLSVFDQGTSVEKSVSYQRINVFYTLRWLWITMGVITVVTSISITVWVAVIFRIAKKQKALVDEARKTGQALPRTGRKENKCPFCNVVFPLGSIVACPYCNAQ